MAASIVTNSTHSGKTVQSCNRAKLAQSAKKLSSLHSCTLSLFPISDFHIELIFSGRVVVCQSDDLYFALLAALASGQEQSISVLSEGV